LGCVASDSLTFEIELPFGHFAATNIEGRTLRPPVSLRSGRSAPRGRQMGDTAGHKSAN
jgi:hypothetical protein